MRWLGVVASLALLGVCLFTQEAHGQGCNLARNCSECLNAGPSCKWCGDRVTSWQNKRCAATTAALVGCQNISNPQGSKNITKSEPLEDEVQVSPQEFFLTMRPGQQERIQVKLQPRANYPLDVYYLMDHSFSFREDLAILKTNSIALAAEISKVSSNYQLGYGSFVDKMIAPCALTYLNRPVKQKPNVKVGYSFHNTFPLQARAAEAFQAKVQAEQISANIDSPEGILDAMMQVAVCEQINWRERARKVMIVSTDANYHSAGDGKLSGIVHFNDGKCHLDGNGYYSKWREQDYPSVGWLNNRLLNSSLFTVFAITEDANVYYKNLASRIVDSRVVTLSKNSDNLVNIVKEELEKLVKEGKITVFPEFGVDIQITAQCPNNEMRTDPTTKFPTCTGLSAGSTATFDIDIKARSCEELKKLDSVTIRFVGYGDVVVKIKPLCSCECEDYPTRTTEWCGLNAEDKCAICVCDEDFTGEFCDCTKKIEPCSNPATNRTCSDRGKCQCGECQCTPVFRNQRVWGKFCECDNTSCPTDQNGQLCGGHGVCDCECKCDEPYYGLACNCTDDNSTCKFPGENRLCSSNGDCNCGTCDCYEGFSGTYCQNCTADVSDSVEQCKDICVRSEHCLACGLTPNREGPCSDCRGYRTFKSPGASHVINIDGEPITAKRCEARDEDGCLIVYWVAEHSEKKNFAPLEIESDTKKCPKPVNYLPLILGIVFGLLLLGLLLLLLWRALISLKDRNEYNHFLTGRDSSRPMGENPLFKKPTQNFTNPQFSG